MKNVILIVLLAIGASGFAQDPEMIGTWYLRAFTADLSDPVFITNNDAPQNPTLIVYSDYSFEGIGACNTFTGQFQYDPVEEVYFHTSFIPTTDDCGDPGYNTFEDGYFAHFDDTLGLFLRYVPIGSGLLLLEIESPGFGMEFQDTVFLGVDENPISLINIYPTITSEYVNVSKPTSIAIEKAIVYNSLGQPVLSVSENIERIDVSSLSKGMYFLQIDSEEGSMTKKFIKG
ncbi:MAG: T9SS type A sorting domain-containing protein [Bacteroidia bacterium]|nr:T9SS type A sorting domain-containing protein [Bacteroidia bacterium]NNF30988.1 T9SS type A sorting domain-containing protein [Flavobacteriaceae bacterium]MBT8274950.1 T9SS type A sorting domain-containing protein [Bacteroidia bacterium]NNJ82563.1 T9SS type A sorting domain-containing protein [Flavobacteriaceae bacterium]NNK54928.1 T9SS type A sorting domain-containing protein [Flavobacteriaceae bacterium]